MIDRTQLTEALEWWVELVADLEPDTETFTVTMSRAMAERTLAAIDQLLDFPTDEQVEAAAKALVKAKNVTAISELNITISDLLLMLEAVTMIGDTQ